MGDRYQGLGRETRGGCLVAAVVGIIALFFDVVRVIGDPTPGTEDLWWRQIPVFIPTIVIVIATFLIVRALIKRNRPDGS